jgi:hypothetical protein
MARAGRFQAPAGTATGREVEPMAGRREVFIRDRKKRSAARKRTHKETQARQQAIATLLRRLEAEEKQQATRSRSA